MSTTADPPRVVRLRGRDLLAAREVVRNAITNLAGSIGDGSGEDLDDFVELREMARALFAVGLVGHPIRPEEGLLDEPLIKSLAKIAAWEADLGDDAVLNCWGDDDGHDPNGPSVAEGRATERRRAEVARRVLAALGAKA